VSHSIAIVDDEHDTVELFKEILTTNGYNVAGFTNPLLALEHIKENHKEFDLILCDYKMSSLSGCDFARKIITEINSAMTIIIITAVTDIGINPLKLQVYVKPLKMSKLIDIVKKNIPSV
jgi:two-component system, OmpR family, response regulator